MIDRVRLLKRVRGWVDNGFRGVDCKLLVLRHVDAEARTKMVHSWDIAADTDVNSLVTEIISTVNDDAEGLGETQAYELNAFFGEASETAAAFGGRFTMTVEGQRSFDVGGDETLGSSESVTTPKAFAAMAGKFAIDVMRTNIPWNNEMMRMQQNIISQQKAQIDELMEERRKNVILHEKLMSQQHKRQMQLRKIMFWEKQKEEMAGILFPMLPVLLSGLAGRPMLPTARTEETVTFEQFVESIKDEQLVALQGVLKPYQLPAIMGIVQATKMKQGIDPTMLREFLKSIDEPQMEEFKKVLTAEQVDLLMGAIAGFMQKYEADQMQRKQAYEEMQKEMMTEEDVDSVPDDAVFR